MEDTEKGTTRKVSLPVSSPPHLCSLDLHMHFNNGKLPLSLGFAGVEPFAHLFPALPYSLALSIANRKKE